MEFKNSITEFDKGMDFSDRCLSFLDRKGHELFATDEEDGQEESLGGREERSRILRQIFKGRYENRRRTESGRRDYFGRNLQGRNIQKAGSGNRWGVFVDAANMTNSRKEKEWYEWRMEQGNSSYDEDSQIKNKWRGGEGHGQDGGFTETRSQKEAGRRSESASYAAAKADERTDRKEPGADPDVKKSAEKAQVKALIKQGKLKEETTGKVLGFWGDDGGHEENKVTVQKDKGLLRTTVSVFFSNITIVTILMIASMALLPVTLGMFVSIHMVSETVEHMLSGFPSRGQILAQGSLTEEEIDEIVANSGANPTQEQVIRFALSKVGFPYSQGPARANGTAFDCSSLAYYAWQAAGVDISYGGGYPPTAAVEASKIYSNGTAVTTTTASADALQPGDLIFYGGHDNGRYLGIYHVAVYLGNGEVVEAMNERYGVVYGTLRTKNVILVLRP
ncbi:MAG: C40 family peptidase [Lachnospiraceae bacterium]|nr:C40 family peptidase [Lachnospiraceae bacterium]